MGSFSYYRWCGSFGCVFCSVSIFQGIRTEQTDRTVSNVIYRFGNARHRRRMGNRPFYGTAWMAPPPYPGPPQNGPLPPYQPPPPQYTPTAAPGYSYFGGQPSGIELQPPQNSYQNVYQQDHSQSTKGAMI